jgi:hypothetical protein
MPLFLVKDPVEGRTRAACSESSMGANHPTASLKHGPVVGAVFSQNVRYAPECVELGFSEVCQESTQRIATWQMYPTITQATLLL